MTHQPRNSVKTADNSNNSYCRNVGRLWTNLISCSERCILGSQGKKTPRGKGLIKETKEKHKNLHGNLGKKKHNRKVTVSSGSENAVEVTKERAIRSKAHTFGDVRVHALLFNEIYLLHFLMNIVYVCQSQASCLCNRVPWIHGIACISLLTLLRASAVSLLLKRYREGKV